ncbi:MAG: hypothetical protein WD889_00540 [Candidatus Colwellbacteria bacterium]
MWTVVIIAAIAVVWWTWRFGEPSLNSITTPTPVVQSDADLNELNSINTDQSIDAEFQQIDQDLNNL